MSPNILSNEDLLQAIRAKSRAGAEVLYDQYGKVLSLVIFRIVRDRELTNFLLEQAIHQIWDAVALYNEQEKPFVPWILRIAKDLALEQIVINKVEPSGPTNLEFKLT